MNLRLVLLLLGAVIVSVNNSRAQDLIKEGYADLSRHNFERDGPLRLSGTWSLYWNRLLSPDEIDSAANVEAVKIPGSWQFETNHPALGYATYRIRLKLDPDQKGLSLFFRIINSSAKIWVNGMVAAEMGHVSENRNEYKPKLAGTLISLPGNKADVDIIIQVANFSYTTGGVGGIPVIDKTSALFSRVNNINGVENFFAGSLIAMFLYQLILYFLFDRGKPYLWLSLICLGVALRALIVHGGSFLLPNLYPSVSWEMWKKLEFGSVYAMVGLFPLYVYHLFPENSPRKSLIFLTSISGLLCVAVLATEQHVYGRLLEICHVMLLLTFIYAFYSIGKAWLAGNKDARVILFGVMASFPFIVAEILKNSNFSPVNIQFMYLVEFGVLVFLLFQVYLLANHYAKSYKELAVVNQNLEKVVEERTRELTTANTVKDRLLSVMSHDIKSPLNSLQGLLQIYSSDSIDKDEFRHFAQHIENDLNKTSLLVENILYWSAGQLKGVHVRKEKFDLYHVTEGNIQLFQTMARNKKIKLQDQTPRGFMITTDRNILNFVIRNLVANAIKYSRVEGRVELLAHREKEALMIQIRDQGVGMDEATIQALLKPGRLASAEGTQNENGTGLGVALCSEYLQKVGGHLSVESIENSGSIFSIVLPGA